jgi:predicted DCC family thiol-disulfide oxidoreductase YuxK
MAQQLPERPFLIFDGDCSFCRVWVEYWKQMTDGVLYVPYQEIGEQPIHLQGICRPLTRPPA